MNKKLEKYNKQELLALQFLKSLGITVNISGCGCCGSPEVTIKYKNEFILKDRSNCNLNSDDLNEE